MLTDQDIDRMMHVFPTKDDVRSIVREEIADVSDTQRHMLNALDRLASVIEKLNLEYAAISEQLSRHERWIQQIAKQAQVKLDN